MNRAYGTLQMLSSALEKQGMHHIAHRTQVASNNVWRETTKACSSDTSYQDLQSWVEPLKSFGKG